MTERGLSSAGLGLVSRKPLSYLTKYYSCSGGADKVFSAPLTTAVNNPLVCTL